MLPFLTLTSPDQLQALGEPTRWGILGVLNDGPASVQELSRAMGIPKGTIGHHVKVLDGAGLIGVAETQRIRGIDEKRYARVARRFRLPDDAETRQRVAGDDDALLGLPLRQAIGEARPAAGDDDPSTSVVVRARMSPERARRFATMIETLAAEFSDGAPGTGLTFGFVAAVYVPAWADRRPAKR